LISDENEPQWLSHARTLSTAEVSDALDFFNLPGSALGIRPVAGPAKLFGQAFTIRFAPIDRFQPGTVGDFIDRVLVLDNAGRLDCTVWGGILSQLAAQKGISGTVINGVCRDTAEADDAGYPLYACGKFMRTGKDRVQVEAYEQPVALGDVRVCNGDLLIGDADGVVVVPRLRMQEVLSKALETRVVEAQILEAALAGMPLAESRKKYGYHTLQRSPTTLTSQGE
jgi:regulator of RNase E activity RraA